MGALQDKVRKARAKASPQETSISARETVSRNAKTSKVSLSMREEQKAANILYSRMKLDRGKTAARGAAIEKVQAKKQATKRINAATGNVTKAKKATPKPKATLSKSEKDFIAGQKFKAKILKKTGKYPNTAR
jgi:hypothetical protein